MAGPGHGMVIFALHRLLQERLLLDLQADEEIAANLEAEPAGRHTRCDLEEVGDDALVQAPDTFLSENNTDCIGEALVLVAHPRHGVDLESSP